MTLDHFVMVRIHARQLLEYKALKYNQQKNSKQFVPEFCYLCLKPLTAPTNRDHIPALQFFAPGIRERYNLSELLTVEVHQQCNSSYERDEQYLVYTLPGFYAWLRGR
jgi:hypothetical protein